MVRIADTLWESMMSLRSGRHSMALSLPLSSMEELYLCMREHAVMNEIIFTVTKKPNSGSPKRGQHLNKDKLISLPMVSREQGQVDLTSHGE